MKVWQRLLLVGAIVGAVLGIAWATGLLDLVQDTERFRETVEDLGLIGPLAYVVLMTVLIPVGVPGVPFVVLSPALWPVPVAIAISVAGGVTSSSIGIIAARRVGRDALEQKIPRWLAGLDRRLTDSGLVGVIVLRVALFLIAPADWVIGLSHVSTRNAIVGTAIGLVPTSAVYVIFGGDFFRWLITPVGLASLAAFLAAVAAVVTLRRRATTTTAAAHARALSQPGALATEEAAAGE